MRAGAFGTEVGEAGPTTLQNRVGFLWGPARRVQRQPKSSREALMDLRVSLGGLSGAEPIIFGDSFQLLGGEATGDHFLHFRGQGSDLTLSGSCTDEGRGRAKGAVQASTPVRGRSVCGRVRPSLQEHGLDQAAREHEDRDWRD